MTLSSLRIKAVMSSTVIPMAAAAVKYGVSVLSQWEPHAETRKLKINIYFVFRYHSHFLYGLDSFIQYFKRNSQSQKQTSLYK